MMAASAISLNSAYKAPVFSESNPVTPYFILLKILPMEMFSDSQIKKKSSIRFWATSVSVLKHLYI